MLSTMLTKTECFEMEDSYTGPHRLPGCLKRFRHLENIQVVINDSAKNLGGWLTTAQYDFVQSEYTSCPLVGSSKLYGANRELVSAHILASLSEVDAKLKDLRFSLGTSWYDSRPIYPLEYLWNSLEILTTLRMTVTPAQLCDEEPILLREDSKWKPTLACVLNDLVKLEDLALNHQKLWGTRCKQLRP